MHDGLMSTGGPTKQKRRKNHYNTIIGKKKGRPNTEAEDAILSKKRSSKVEREIKARQADQILDPALDEQFATGRLYAAISSRPGQVGRCDGYILEGKELQFYLRKLRARR